MKTNMSNVYPTRPGQLDFSNRQGRRAPQLNPMRQGDTFRRFITLEDFDLTGHDLRCSVREKPDDSAPILFMSTGNGMIEILEPTLFKFEVAPAISEPLEVGVYHYDVEIVTPAGDVYTLFEGRWDVVREITKEAD